MNADDDKKKEAALTTALEEAKEVQQLKQGPKVVAGPNQEDTPTMDNDTDADDAGD